MPLQFPFILGLTYNFITSNQQEDPEKSQMIQMDQWQCHFSNISLQGDLEPHLPDPNPAAILDHAGGLDNASTLPIVVHSYVFVDEHNDHLQSAWIFYILYVLKMTSSLKVNNEFWKQYILNLLWSYKIIMKNSSIIRGNPEICEV